MTCWPRKERLSRCACARSWPTTCLPRPCLCGTRNARAGGHGSHLDKAIVGKWAAYLKPVAERRAHLEPWYNASPAAREKTAADYQKSFIATATLRRQAMATWRQESTAAKAAGKEAPPAPKFQPGDDRFFTEVASGKGPFALPEKDRDSVISEGGRTRLASLQSELKESERLRVLPSRRSPARLPKAK